MNNIGKTFAFVITAALLGIAAASSYWLTQPKPVVGFEKVGEEFFPDFQDAMAATSLYVSAYNEETDGLQEFSVELKDGLWRIPSHHDYPAEAADRLARTATSLIGLVRESVAARRANKHEELGVIDPADTEAIPDTAGKRITLKDSNGKVLADYIIGKPAGSVVDDDQKMIRDLEQDDDFYYVRVPDEKETYKARLQIDLSTRFKDWINPDLLKVEADEFNRLEIDNYELVEERTPNQLGARLSKKVIDRQRLTRTGLAPWELEGLNPETEELDTLRVEELVTLLDSMEISGVRPKLTLNGELLIRSDLSVNEELARKDPQTFQRRVYQLQQDLEMKGFTFGASESDPSQVSLLATKGELRAATNDGVLYTLYFGRSVSGDQNEIEIGATLEPSTDETSDTDAEPESVAETGDANASASETGDNDADQPNRSRYVAIRVDFDPSALGEVPVKPTEPAKPEKPEGYDAWKAEQEKQLEQAGDDNPRDEDAAAETESDEGDDESPDPPQDIENANEKAFQEYDLAIAEYEKAAIQYSTDLELFETRNEAYQKREQNGKDKVAELNERFGEWFYVVPAESLANLKLTRGDLVKIRETPPPNANSPMAPGDFGNPGRSPLPTAPNIKFDNNDDADAPADSPTPESDGQDGNEAGEGNNSGQGNNSAEGDGKSENDQDG